VPGLTADLRAVGDHRFEPPARCLFGSVDPRGQRNADPTGRRHEATPQRGDWQLSRQAKLKCRVAKAATSPVTGAGMSDRPRWAARDPKSPRGLEKRGSGRGDSSGRWTGPGCSTSSIKGPLEGFAGGCGGRPKGRGYEPGRSSFHPPPGQHARRSVGSQSGDVFRRVAAPSQPLRTAKGPYNPGARLISVGA
jgi:hypothetical protein